ncbi:DUF6164 family protein [Gilvimarinus sp. F26214L]|uniref:DUF6164 family protein n=1 Tax=Gilvimarinus sp. DZF01 TaxID=3461371 RepID=UPI004046629B
MSTLLFRLNNVPEEEAVAVRDLLLSEGIEFYETHAGAFGIGVAAIWLPDGEDVERARHLLADFQARHRDESRRRWQDDLAQGQADNFLRRLRREPLKVVLLLIAVGVILYVSIVPWLSAWDTP